MANTFSQIYIQTVFAISEDLTLLRKFDIAFEEKYVFEFIE